MAIKNTKLGGTDYTGERMYSADLNATFNATFAKFARYHSSDLGDNASTPAGTIASSTTETVLASTTIAANTVNTALIVIAGVEGQGNNTDSAAIFCIYAGTNADGSYGPNPKYRQMTVSVYPATNRIVGEVIMYVITGLNWAVTNYVQVTGKNNTSHATHIATVHDLIVLGN
jgi:hypothetical protein